MDETAAHPFFDTGLRREAAGESRPLIVVLPHSVVEPAGVGAMSDGVAWKPQADHLVDRLPIMRHADVGQPR